jgi:hypothetical protein
MNYKSVAGASAGEHSIFGRAAIRRAFASTVVGLTAFLSLLSIAQADQLLVTGANRDGSAVYDLGISPSSSNPSGATPIKPVFANSVTQINNAADEKTHSGFDALVWVPNPVCQSLDLIVADASNGQIVRYAGATTLANCNAPASSSSGTPIVNPVAQVLFKWSKRGSGPAQPTGISADAYGNLFVVSSSGSWDPAASVWVLPFNKTKNLYCAGTGNYCAPVLVDGKFCGTTTQQLSEVLVAGIPAVTSGKNTLWNAGDVLVLVGDSFDARLIAYAQAKLYSSKTKGLLNLAALPLSQPTSTPIPWSAFHGQSAAPAGMDIWPANPVWHTNTTMLFTTADGRILEFDTLLNKFVCNFAQNRGPGLQKIKVGSYASVSYAFVAQLEAHNTGQILVFGAAPTSGANNPIKTISSGIMNPQGLAVISSGSASLTAPKKGTTPCAPPNAPCVIAPLGPELVSTITAYPGDNLSGTVLEQNCIIGTDPRVTVGQGGWSCNGNALPIGAGTNYCPTFPAAVIPGSACGHSGPTGAGFAVIEGTATGIDPNDNNSFITTAGNIDAVLPGPNNLECTPAAFAATGQIPLIAWGPRSDLTTVEGIIPEDTLYGPYLGGEPGYLTELTGGCDTSTTGSRELSIFAIGLGLSYTDQTGVYTLQNQKYEALGATVNSAAITTMTVKNTLSSDITTAESYVTAAQGDPFPSTAFTNNINCALNEIAATDTYLRGNLPAFSSNLVTTGAGGGNANPAGDIDGRLANWYTTLNTMLAGNAPYVSWPLPAGSVPPCIPSTQPQITSFTAPVYSDNDNVYANWTSVNTTSCTLTTLYAYNSEGSGYNFYSASGLPTGGGDYGGDGIYYIIPDSDDEQTQYPPNAAYGWGTDTYTLTCYGADGTTPATASILNASGFTTPTETPLSITSFVGEPPSGYVGYVAWQTANSTGATTCTITDEFGGPPYNQAPTGNLPANVNLPETNMPPYEGPYGFNVFCPESGPGQNTDTLTLTCSDPNNGTAIATLTITNPGCDE